jgi:type VI secretion system protein ImpH
MAASLGRTDPSVADILLKSPWDFEFTQVVRLLASMYPNRRPISGFRESLDESIRFQANRSMLFPPSEIQDIAPRTEESDPFQITVNFMGLTGPMGVLPAHYTEYLIARSYSHDGAAAAFFDLFNHRLVSLFYLAWEKYHFPVCFERESHPAGPHWGFTRYLYDLIGMGTFGLQGRLQTDDPVLLSYAGLIAQRPHSATALTGMLRDHFQVPVEIVQFVGKWCRLDPDDQTSLGTNDVSGQLGCGAIAGDLVWNPQARFRIRVGPLTWKRFQSYLPDGSALPEMITLARYFTNQAMEFEVQVVLAAPEVPEFQLSDDQGSARLGLSSWLRTQAFSTDAEDLLLTVHSNGEQGERKAS